MLKSMAGVLKDRRGRGVAQIEPPLPLGNCTLAELFELWFPLEGSGPDVETASIAKVRPKNFVLRGRGCRPAEEANLSRAAEERDELAFVFREHCDGDLASHCAA